MASANAVLDIIDDENLCDRASHVGATIVNRLQDIASRQGMERIGDVRGLGAMVAFELVTDRDTLTPDPATAAALVAEAERRGLIILVCGTSFNVIRLLPPLTIEEQTLNEALEILEASIEATLQTPITAA